MKRRIPNKVVIERGMVGGDGVPIGRLGNLKTRDSHKVVLNGGVLRGDWLF